MDKETIERVLSSCEFKKGVPTREELIAEIFECRDRLNTIVNAHPIFIEAIRLKFSPWRNGLNKFRPTRKSNPELYAIVDELCCMIGVKCPRNIKINPFHLMILNISEAKAMIASHLLDSSNWFSGVFRIKEKVSKFADTVSSILLKTDEKSCREDGTVIEYIYSHIEYCSSLLKDYLIPEIVGTDAYKSYICKTKWINRCCSDFNDFFEKDGNKICSDIYGAWQAYLNKREEIDDVSLDPSSPMLTPYLEVPSLANTMGQLKYVGTQYGWHWAYPLSAVEICNNLSEIPFFETKWDNRPVSSQTDPEEYYAIMTKITSEWQKQFISYKRKVCHLRTSDLISVDDFKASMSKVFPSFLEYFLRDGLFEEEFESIYIDSKNAPIRPLSDLFNLTNACAFESYSRQNRYMNGFIEISEESDNSYLDEDGIDFFYTYNGTPLESNFANKDNTRINVNRLLDNLLPLAASIFRSLNDYTSGDTYKKLLWRSHLFNMSMKVFIRSMPLFFHDTSKAAKEFLNISKNYLSRIIQDKSPLFSRLFIHVLKESPNYYKSIKTLVEYAELCDYDQDAFLSYISDKSIYGTTLEVLDYLGPGDSPVHYTVPKNWDLNYVFPGTPFVSIVEYVRNAINESVRSTHKLLIEDVIGPAIASNNNKKQ